MGDVVRLEGLPEQRVCMAANPIEYIHSPAKFYLTGVQGIYPVTNFMEMEEVNFNLSKD